MNQCPQCKAYLFTSYCAKCRKDINEMEVVPKEFGKMFGEDFLNIFNGKEKDGRTR